MKFLIACGGTGGHINPGLAVAAVLKETFPGCDILFVGSGRKIEKKLIPEAGYPLENIDMRGFERGFSPKILWRDAGALWLLRTALSRAQKLVDGFKPDFALGTGGYICYPILSAAARRKIPTAIHEANAEPGLTTKLLSRRVARVFAAFPETAGKCREPGRVTVVGTPVRAGFLTMTRSRARRALRIPPDEPLVVSFWGSLGASHMNERMAGFIARNLRERAFQHIHATGGGEEVRARFTRAATDRELPPWVDVRAYIDDMPRVMAAADIVLARAGASTLAELSALGRPAVLVPSPFVTRDHQTANAKAVCAHGAAIMIPEAECSPDRLFDTVTELRARPERRREMAKRQRELGAREAANRLVSEIVSML